ncbi:glucoside xylosyltransferase 1 [Neocloeon triangulifer]|uniref:glucoside xylosyltransferase 1 n=1 Tax=Neocloeon triangulifer TaxID=2078957 RepID=UPI00286F91D1|nr:glucoside xylosyltransferase 1 [Neocloeon triangulifer]
MRAAMKLAVRTTVLLLLFAAAAAYVLYVLHESDAPPPDASDTTTKAAAPRPVQRSSVRDYGRKAEEEEVVLAVVACGDRLQETLVMLKSALTFTQAPLRFIVFAEEQLGQSFTEKLKEWSGVKELRFRFEVRPIELPRERQEEWRRLFKPCASQRLFLPNLLQDLDALLYVDTDTLFLTPLERIWQHLHHFNSSQMAALTPEHEDRATGWYNRFARHPYYGPLGVNSGVMLMNLTRMRNFGWIDYVMPIYQEYKLKITWGDQDIINILFHFHPDKLYVYPCRYNFRPDHCMYMSVCESADKEGVAVVHGNRGSFHSEKQPAFHAVYRAMEEYQLGTDPYRNLLLPLRHYLEETSDTNCGKVRRLFLKSAEQFINAIYD